MPLIVMLREREGEKLKNSETCWDSNPRPVILGDSSLVPKPSGLCGGLSQILTDSFLIDGLYYGIAKSIWLVLVNELNIAILKAYFSGTSGSRGFSMHG